MGSQSPPLAQAEILIFYNRSCIGNDSFWSLNQIKFLEGSEAYIFIYIYIYGRLSMGAYICELLYETFIWELLYVYKETRIEKLL